MFSAWFTHGTIVHEWKRVNVWWITGQRTLEETPSTLYFKPTYNSHRNLLWRRKRNFVLLVYLGELDCVTSHFFKKKTKNVTTLNNLHTRLISCVRINNKSRFCLFQQAGKIILCVLGAAAVVTLIAVPTAIYLNGMCNAFQSSAISSFSTHLREMSTFQTVLSHLILSLWSYFCQ